MATQWTRSLNTVRCEAECSIDNFKFTVWPASVSIFNKTPTTVSNPFNTQFEFIALNMRNTYTIF